MRLHQTMMAFGAACLILSTAASAEVIVFDNSDGDFNWSAQLPLLPFPTGTKLDITLPSSQNGTANGVGRTTTQPTTALPMCSATVNIVTAGPFAIARDIDMTSMTFPLSTEDPPQCGFNGFLTHTFAPGETVGPSDNWQTTAIYAIHRTCGSCTTYQAVLLGEEAYIGVRFGSAGNFQYGWVHLVQDGVAYDPIEWAYETELNAPIEIPSPGCGSEAGLADLDQSGGVDGIDLGILLGAWSFPAGAPGCGGAKSCCADVDQSGSVNGMDLGILLSQWTLR